ncbi:ABC transporter substrate-binding protein [uncultured Ruegeria sp.]|uniref:ABC transporter substrate-binding protein n=1 Tax=uncultured Ruegeria sp. TaxID=259304 RepID=UPI002601D049|nr:ABC transporter substrate-binding protein [uncultured Ruegeria sp.]
MRFISKTRLLASSLLVSASMFGLAAAATAQDATFVVSAQNVGTPSYNPINGTKLNDAITLIFDRMVIQDADQSFHGQLATEWESTSDGMSWTFKLRPGVTFHDGEPFNADTIVWWIPQFADTENAFMTDAIESVEVIDDLTVRFVMKNPDPNLLSNMSSGFMGIPSPRAFDELGDDFGVTVAIGSGPFKLESFTVGQETVLSANEDYAWASDLSENQGAPHIKTLTFREISEDSTAFLELSTGGVDMLYSVPTDFLPRLEAEDSVQVGTMPGTGLFYIPINTTVEPFTDINVREAAAFAINQKEILDNLYGGVGSVANTFLIDSLLSANVDPALKISYDPDRSNALLDEAGWMMGSDGVREMDGTKLQVALWTQNGTEFKRVTEVVQAQLKAVGIGADITVFDSATINDQYRKGTDHQLAVRSYSWANADIIDWFFSGERLGYPNVSMWNDATAEEMNAAAMKGSRTWEERVTHFTTYHEYVLSQFVFAPIYQPVQIYAYSKESITVPEAVRGTRLQSQTVVDITVN